MTCRLCDVLWRFYRTLCGRRPFDRDASLEIDRLVSAVEARDELVVERDRVIEHLKAHMAVYMPEVGIDE